jgi:DNA-binding NarL/FixJ family response regulator
MTPRLKVLIVDDHPLLREVLREALAGSGFEVDEASTAAEALAAVDAAAPTVVVCDTRLPDEDGVWTMREIRHRHPSVPVVMMSAFLSEEQNRVLVEEGASACLSKETPFSTWGRTILAVLQERGHTAAPPVAGTLTAPPDAIVAPAGGA